MSVDLDVASGHAQMLEDAGLGAYRPDGSAFIDGETAIALGEPPQWPGLTIGITPYPVSDLAPLTEAVLALQFMYRGPDTDPRPVWIVRDAVLDLLQGKSAYTVNGQVVGAIWRQMSAPLGVDAVGRHEHADTYYLNITRPTTASRAD